MLTSLLCTFRIALVLSLSVGFVGLHSSEARAAGDDDDEGDGGDAGDGGDSASGDEPGDGDGEAEDPKDQPPVTAGGLFTIKTYPVRELSRPLTMTQQVTQLRLGLGTDVSDKTAFQFFGVSLDAKYGYTDNFTLLGGFSGDYNFKGFSLAAGFEGALAYDTIGIRLQARLNRTAQVAKLDTEGGTFKPTDFQKGAGTQFSIDVGFPFRYVAKPEIAIVALETLFSINFNSIKRGTGGTTSCFADPMTAGFDAMNCVENGAKPDLAPSLGIATNPIPALSVVVFAQLQIRDFDTTNQFSVPATIRVQFSPNQKFDIGLEFKFLDLKPKDPDGDGPAPKPSPIDQRFMNMFIQARY